MNLTPLLKRTLILVAHPDDETGGCGILLQRIAVPLVVFATDGAPNDHWFWNDHETRSCYAQRRREEALAALALAGVGKVRFIADQYSDCTDQRLYKAIPWALQALTRLVVAFGPEALLVPAYEGGHPDHDACNFLAFVVGRHFGIPVWEMPLYHRLASGRLSCQQFIDPNGTERVLWPRRAEWERKRQMVASYGSQPALSRFVPSTTERFRPLPAYDYAQPPHGGLLNYEAWQWPMTGAEVSDEFAACLRRLGWLDVQDSLAAAESEDATTDLNLA